MGKKKKKKHKYSEEEEFLLKTIDKDILSQYHSIREDTERFQYQLAEADRKTKKKFNKAMKSGKLFNFNDTPSIKARKKVLKELDENNLINRILYLYNEWSPIMKLLGRCLALLITAILSIDMVKRTISKDKLEQMDRLFNIAMSV